MGIFRPVHLLVTSDIYIEPLVYMPGGIKNNDKAVLKIETTIRNHSPQTKEIIIIHQLLDSSGKEVITLSQQHI